MKRTHTIFSLVALVLAIIVGVDFLGAVARQKAGPEICRGEWLYKIFESPKFAQTIANHDLIMVIPNSICTQLCSEKLAEAKNHLKFQIIPDAEFKTYQRGPGSASEALEVVHPGWFGYSVFVGLPFEKYASGCVAGHLCIESHWVYPNHFDPVLEWLGINSKNECHPK